ANGLGFFFSSRRRHTRSKRDWSSDVCSSDLGPLEHVIAAKAVSFKVAASEAFAERQRRTIAGARILSDRLTRPDMAEVGVKVLRSEERRVGKEGRTGGARRRCRIQAVGSRMT